MLCAPAYTYERRLHSANLYTTSFTLLARPPPPWTSVFRFSLFLYKMCGLEKLGLVDQNWLERNFSGFLLRTLVVGRRQHSESIEVALEWSKEV